MKPRPPSRGFALMAVLWCVMIMTVAVMGVAIYVSTQLDENIARARMAEARYLALSGVAYGLQPKIKRHDPLLRQEPAPGRTFQVTLQPEDGRINVNYLLQANRTDILERLWVEWGLSLDQARALDDCLQDWIQPGTLKRLNGAKQAEYAALGHPELPPGRPFQSLDEMRGVIGFAALEKAKPDWRDFLTLWSNGKLDLDEAPAELIAAFCDIPLAKAVSYVQQRDPSGQPGMPDGWHAADIEEAIYYLGMTKLDIERTAPLLEIDGAVWRVESVGMVQGCRHTIVVISSRDGLGTAYYLWQEF